MTLPGYAHPGLVVAVHVRAHGQLGLLLGRGEQGADVLGVGQRVAAAGDRPGDRAGLDPVAGHPHVHLRRRADQVLALAQVEEELVRRRVALPQPLVEGRGRAAGPVEDVAGHHLEQVTAGEPLPRLLHDPRERPWPRVAGRFSARNGTPLPHLVRHRLVNASANALGGRAGHLEFVAEAGRGFPLAVQHVQPVGQVQHEVTLVRWPGVPEPHRLELERQVVPERAVKAQVRVRPGERGDDLAQRREHRGPPAPLLLGERANGLRYDHLDLRGRARPDLITGTAHRVTDYGQQDLTTFVQRRRGDLASPGDQLDARVHVRHVPPAVSARVFHAGAEHPAAAGLDLPGHVVQQGRVERGVIPADPDPARGIELLLAHVGTRLGVRPEARRCGQ